MKKIFDENPIYENQIEEKIEVGEYKLSKKAATTS